jgi:hypothetical protein
MQISKSPIISGYGIPLIGLYYTPLVSAFPRYFWGFPYGLNCGMPNFSTSLFESFMVNMSNTYDHLSDSDLRDSTGQPIFIIIIITKTT